MLFFLLGLSLYMELIVLWGTRLEYKLILFSRVVVIMHQLVKTTLFLHTALEHYTWEPLLPPTLLLGELPHNLRI